MHVVRSVILRHQADTIRALSLFESYKGALKRLKLGLNEFTIIIIMIIQYIFFNGKNGR